MLDILDKPAKYDTIASMSSLLEQRFLAIERLTGFTLTVYDLGRRLNDDSLPPDRKLHASDFCKRVKRRKHGACIRCDNDQLFMTCLEKRTSFIRTCHAGADELIIPVLSGKELLCVAFLGQFISEENACPPARQLPTLRRIDAAEAAMLIDLGEVLRGFMAFHASMAGAAAAGLPRRIDTFIRENLPASPSLEDLARELKLSTSRTRHLVKEACGKNFRTVRDEIRLRSAMDLLAGTNASLEFVARQSGFNDSDYFCRFFKKHAGDTPGEYRRTAG